MTSFRSFATNNVIMTNHSQFKSHHEESFAATSVIMTNHLRPDQITPKKAETEWQDNYCIPKRTLPLLIKRWLQYVERTFAPRVQFESTNYSKLVHASFFSLHFKKSFKESSITTNASFLTFLGKKEMIP